MMRVLVTGSAGFIGFHVVQRLLRRGDAVIGIDSVNDYYDVALKRARLAESRKLADELGADYRFVEASIADKPAFDACFADARPDRVIHMAAQAGVRYASENPLAYVESNILGFTNVLEACRHAGTAHLTYASSSSVYGANRTMPFSEKHHVDHPLQFYAATKRAGELMAHSYSHLYGLPTTALRFFTVYGPWGRPDMAPLIFTRAIVEGTPIRLFNHGNHARDFTFIDDIAEGVVRASDDVATPDPDWLPSAPTPDTSEAPFRIFNIGNNDSVPLVDFLRAIEDALGKKAITVPVEAQPGDVPETFADVSALENRLGYRPEVPVREGVRRLVAWYRAFYNV
jgi:UDP-glucuronate 4-epimerase